MKKSLIFGIGVAAGTVVGVAGGCLKKHPKKCLVTEHEKHILEVRIKDGLSTAKNIQAVDKDNVSDLDDCIVELTQYLDALREDTIYDNQFADMWKNVTDIERGIVNAGLFLLLNSDTFDPDIRESMATLNNQIIDNCSQIKNLLKETDLKLRPQYLSCIEEIEQTMLNNKRIPTCDLMIACHAFSDLVGTMVSKDIIDAEAKKGSLFDAFKDEDEAAKPAAITKTSTSKRSTKSKPANEKKTDEQSQTDDVTVNR